MVDRDDGKKSDTYGPSGSRHHVNQGLKQQQQQQLNRVGVQKEHVIIVVVVTLGSHGVVNQMDRRYLTFCHRHGPPSFKEDREVGEDHLRLS